DAVRPDADLDPADQLALPKGEVGDAEKQRHDDGDDERQVHRGLVHRRAPERAELRLAIEEELVEHQALFSTSSEPNIGPRPAVEGCAAATRTQSSGSRSSRPALSRACPP